MDISKRIGFVKILRIFLLMLAVTGMGLILQRETRRGLSSTLNPLACVFPEAKADVFEVGSVSVIDSGESCECSSC